MDRQWPPRAHALPAVFKPGNETVGLLKSVHHQPSTYFRDLMASPDRLFEVAHCFDFDASFYFSNHVLTSPTKRARDAVVMVNGLNEIHHSHFGHYDRLGSALAHRRIAGVLHPTPFHLNRTAYLREDRRSEYVARGGTQRWPMAAGTPDMKRHPSRDLMRRPVALAQCFEQVSNEIVLMAKTLRRREGGLDREHDAEFYDSLFEPRCRVSLLGYSMGGLQALYTFLRYPSLFHRCILINSGVTIADLNSKPINIGNQEWADMAARAKASFGEATDIHDPGLLRAVLFGEGLDERIEARRVMFISGGADKVASATKVQKLASTEGLTVLEIAGLGHPLKSPIFDRYFPLIISAIEEFVMEPREGDDTLSAEDIVGRLKRFTIGGERWDHKLQGEQGPDGADYLDDTENLIPDVLDRIGQNQASDFYTAYLMSKRYFADDAELLRAMERMSEA